jgi:hypothetical protein
MQRVDKRMPASKGTRARDEPDKVKLEVQLLMNYNIFREIY